jgi:clostripain
MKPLKNKKEFYMARGFTKVRIFLFILLIVGLLFTPSCDLFTNNDGGGGGDTGGDSDDDGDDDGGDDDGGVGGATNHTWLVMVYMDGANNLEEAAVGDFVEIYYGVKDSQNPNLNVLILFDRISGYSNDDFGDGNWTDTGLYLITEEGYYNLDGSGSNLPNTDDGHDSGDEQNMGDPETLKNFISFGMANYASDYTTLILWNHGGGVRSAFRTRTVETEKSVCWDEESSNDCLYTDEVQQALTDSGLGASNKLTNIALDACLMATVEEAYEYRNHAETFTASMASEQGDGWDYEALLGTIASGGADTPAEYAVLAVQQYEDSTGSSFTDQTQSSIDMSQISAVKTAVDSLAVEMYIAVENSENAKGDFESVRDRTTDFDYGTPYYNFFDLWEFCQEIQDDTDYGFSTDLTDAASAVQTALENAVIVSYGGSDYGGYAVSDGSARGLSMFFPYGEDHDGSSDSYYSYCWWYTDVDTAGTYGSGYYYGLIDFCSSNADGVVEGWRELFEKWYDSSNSYTPSSY